MYSYIPVLLLASLFFMAVINPYSFLNSKFLFKCFFVYYDWAYPSTARGSYGRLAGIQNMDGFQNL